ncbi:MFS transporter [Chloracidobacterium aggregatum]|uniref:MFS transporter n=1 Tax=Chloracidobacterium sp. N TaxID=2821540 RepID=A0ABX8B1V4_9BACT|nr:MFS transporter [Chloracidobacterium aggregatum]QUV85120.1 MFS transporter [Chloracidobacterium sp. 2]QUV88478.1 MFS transporter [Chloracidobacterium sp. S]QUV91401.1 MFS transporter [Chloracidobacterium sp. A]QUV94577.1 MFS transporter [Chloracidobacterium sp. N]
MMSGPDQARRASLLIFIVTLVDQIGWGMVIPILPTYARTFGGSAVVVGWLLASYSIAQLLFAPAIGRLSDRKGRKPLLLACMGGSAVAAAATGAASLLTDGTFALGILFLARALDGVTGGNTALAMSYASDVSSPERRAQSLGLIGAAIGLGYTIGPALGGVIAHYTDAATPFYVAAGLALSNALVMWWLLPESLSPEQRAEATLQHQEGHITSLGSWFRHPQLGPLLIINFLFIVAASCYQMMLPLYTNLRFGLGERDNSYLFAFLGLTMTVVQGGCIRPLVHRFGERTIFAIGIGLLTATLAVAPFADTVTGLVWLCGGMGIGTALANPTLLALLTNRAAEDERGEVLGVAASVASLGRILAPAWCGYAMKHVSVASPFVTGASVAALAAAVFLAFVAVKTTASARS